MTKRDIESNRIMTITPTMARRWLATQIGNRSAWMSLVDQYATDMRRGAWHENGETIKFGADGRLIDGQHRLLACIQSGKSFRSYVVRGIDVERAFHSIDVGRSRSKADFLSFHGKKNTMVLAAVARTFGAIMTKQPQKSIGAKYRPTESMDSRDYLLEYITKYPIIEKAANWVVPYKKELAGLIAASVVGASVAACAAIIDEDLAFEFGEQLALGEGLTRTSPVYKIREKFRRVALTPSVRSSPSSQLVLILRTWGYWITNTPTPKTPYVGGSKNTIPQIIGPNDSIGKMQHTADAVKANASRRKKRTSKKRAK